MDPLRIASVPATHPYVDHLAPVTGVPGTVGLPRAVLPIPPQGCWQPSPALQASWVREHAADFDVLHVHFGFEHRSVAQLLELLTALRAAGRPLVLTVHDLQNPHLVDQSAHSEALDVLVPAAAAVVTLTTGAVQEIHHRWGRDAMVAPHPHLAPLDQLGAARTAAERYVVGLHAKARANVAADDVRAELAVAVDGLGAVLAPSPTRRLSDDELWDHLRGLDVLVLPYAFGTHSGFVEACHDLGTVVVASRVGYLHEQQQLIGFDLGVAGSLTAALEQAHRARPAWQADRAARARQRDELARRHDRLYREAIEAAA